jgi:hypothetical protein
MEVAGIATTRLLKVLRALVYAVPQIIHREGPIPPMEPVSVLPPVAVLPVVVAAGAALNKEEV